MQKADGAREAGGHLAAGEVGRGRVADGCVDAGGGRDAEDDLVAARGVGGVARVSGNVVEEGDVGWFGGEEGGYEGGDCGVGWSGVHGGWDGWDFGWLFRGCEFC